MNNSERYYRKAIARWLIALHGKRRTIVESSEEVGSVRVPRDRLVVVGHTLIVRSHLKLPFAHILEVSAQVLAVDRALTHFQIGFGVVVEVIDAHLITDGVSTKSYVSPVGGHVPTRVDQHIAREYSDLSLQFADLLEVRAVVVVSVHFWQFYASPHVFRPNSSTGQMSVQLWREDCDAVRRECGPRALGGAKTRHIEDWLLRWYRILVGVLESDLENARVVRSQLTCEVYSETRAVDPITSLLRIVIMHFKHNIQGIVFASDRESGLVWHRVRLSGQSRPQIMSLINVKLTPAPIAQAAITREQWFRALGLSGEKHGPFHSGSSSSAATSQWNTSMWWT